MDTIQTAVDTVMPGGKFQIFSGILKASREGDGRMKLHGVASSTTRDLHGDTMEQSALEDMERAANNNLTIFLNHSYDVPEDVAGSVERASMRLRGADHVGNPNYDLDFDILVNDANPRAVKAFEAIERGTKLGLSIGALVPDGGAVRDKKSGTYLIQHVDLLETSLVGIPANPRSWVEYAAKSLRGMEKDATTVPLGQPTLTLDGNSYTISGTVDGLTTVNTGGTVSNSTTIVNGSTTTWVDQWPDATIPEHEPDVVLGTEPEVADDIEPDVADAQVTIIQIDTDGGSSSSDSAPADAPEEGHQTDPEGEFASVDDGAVIEAAATPEPMSEVLSLLRTTTGELVTARSEVATLKGQLAALELERDALAEERDRVLKETKEILDRVADAPLVRRAVAMEAQRELRTRFSGYLSDDFLKMLES